ncbi:MULTISPECIES: hypothetical protein [unclassified Caballeronia]|uniref:hypothetical protein n=1 Tax=unclassified Caballeronia TaxID=2646786 RepID=UPI002029B062|nr:MULTISPECIES: hypothetical protein [unclassified Caballeronia]
MNHYQLIAHGQTSGWNPSANEVNGKNFYGMLPVEVAAQAGDVDEFEAIVSHPEFNASGARPHRFAAVGRLSDCGPGFVAHGDALCRCA